MNATFGELKSPLGVLAYAVGPEGLWALRFSSQRQLERALVTQDGAKAPDARLAAQVRKALLRYFAGELSALDGLPVAPQGTLFQQRVWSALRQIPAGTTWSYAQLARHVGRPTATRAVGAANRANPVALVVPCHRVVAKGGGLGGYFAGLDRKRWLLKHERAWPRQDDLFGERATS